MCGRFSQSTPPNRIAELMDAQLGEHVAEEWSPRWNIAPTRTILGVSARQGRRLVDAFRWGLVPGWAKDPGVGDRAFNARAESVDSKPMFRRAFAGYRLLVPADAYYEWLKRPDGSRQPFAFRRADGGPLFLAGLWAAWHDPTRGEAPEAWLRSCTIITTAAGADNVPVHDRQPAVVEPADWETWLSGDDPAALKAILVPSLDGTLVRWPVGRAVGSVRNDGPELLAEVGLDDAAS